MNTIPGLGKNRKETLDTPIETPGLNRLDRERAGSMADEGGASGMVMETQRDTSAGNDGPLLEWYQTGRRPSPMVIAAGVVLGLVSIAAVGFVVTKLARA